VLRTRVFGGAASALRIPVYRNYFLGHFIASNGRWMYRMSIGWLAWDLTHSTLWLGAVAFADLVPSAVLTIFAGAITDRFGYMRIIRGSLVVVILLAALLGALVLAHAITVELLLVIALLSGSAESLGQPARLAIVNALVPRYDLSSAIALGSTSFNASRIVGPGIAGLLIEAVADQQKFHHKQSAGAKWTDVGLWRWSRHPNYFGDSCVWFGIFLVAASAGSWAWVGIVSPIVMTYFLRFVSGVVMLERSLVKRRPAYAEYMRTTSAFFPRPPRK
jgi:MFS family permease